jgi:RHS repeat-associated protein
VTEYVWDYRNRLAGVLFKDAGGVVTKTIEYLYDVNDRRIGKKVDGGTTERYVYDGSDIALVFDGAGSQTHRYLYGTGVDTVLADERGAAVVWALSDNQGTIRDIVDNNGVILNHINYDSFGKVVSQSNAGVDFRYGYTGREQDGETGLDYYRARYYDASNGRFISEDPLGFGAGDTNIYRYVGNSPTNFTDPSGECPPCAAATAVGTALGITSADVGAALAFVGLGGVCKQVHDYITRLPEGEINPSPPPFPNPNNDRLRLGNNQVEGYPSHPGTLPPLGGFDLGHGRGNNLVEGFPNHQDDSGLDNYVFNHGNSNSSTNPQHVYIIKDPTTGKLIKVGISGQDLNNNGDSPRANPQVSKLNQSNPGGAGAVVVEPNAGTRPDAKDIEQEITDKYGARNNGDQPSNIHQRPKATVSTPQEFYDKYGYYPNGSPKGRGY